MKVFVLLKYSNHCYGEDFEATVFYSYSTAKDMMIAQWNKACQEWGLDSNKVSDEDNLSEIQDFYACLDGGDDCIRWDIQKQDIL